MFIVYMIKYSSTCCSTKSNLNRVKFLDRVLNVSDMLLTTTIFIRNYNTLKSRK